MGAKEVENIRSTLVAVAMSLISKSPFIIRNSINFVKSKNYGVGCQAVRHGRISLGQTSDWKPGPYPLTEEERIAAAAKYNMIPEDYEPHPLDGAAQYGDYPMLPRIHADMRDRHEWFPISNSYRHFGEPIHVDGEQLTWDQLCGELDTRLVSFTEVYLTFIGLNLLCIFIGYIDYTNSLGKFEMPKQWPHTCETHYDFENLVKH